MADHDLAEINKLLDDLNNKKYREFTDEQYDILIQSASLFRGVKSMGVLGWFIVKMVTGLTVLTGFYTMVTGKFTEIIQGIVEGMK